MFLEWAFADGAPAYGSWGNGAAMRVAPIAYAADTLDAAIDLARRSASVSHDHPEAIKGAQAVVSGVFMALSGESAPTIRRQISYRFGYDLSPSVDAIRPTYSFDVSCQGTVKATPGSVNVPVILGGITINPGDVVCADDDGVTVVAREEAAWALEKSQERLVKEEETRGRLEAGELGVDFYGLRQKIIDLGVEYI